MLSLQTNRLSFRLWHESDFPAFAHYFSDNENTVYLGGIKTKEESWRLMACYIGHYLLKGYSYLAIEEKSTKNWVGAIGLWNSEPWPEPELGFWVLKEKQGNGYAFEAAKKVKEFAFENLKTNTLVSYIHADNTASIHLAKKLGGKFDGKIDLLDFGPHDIYRYEK